MRASIYKEQQQVPSSPQAWHNREFTSPWIFVKGHKTQFLLNKSAAIVGRSQQMSKQINHSDEIKKE